MSFVTDTAIQYGIPPNHLLVLYLERKTKAADRGSKARRSLGNLYALFVIAEDYLAGRQSRFTDLLARMRSLPFGSKLQNHPLDNRLNDEFRRQHAVEDALLPVQNGTLIGTKSRIISSALLSNGGADPLRVAQFVTAAIQQYVGMITANQNSELEDILAIETVEELCEFFEDAFAPTSDARMFEVVSYVLLAHHYRNQFTYIGTSMTDVQRAPLALYRTGRTNANDGGIDFVLQPLGRFFQVTETIDFKKYFLDFEKVNRYPISFVVKVNDSPTELVNRIRADAQRSGYYSAETIEMYMNLFQEVFTLQSLFQIAGTIEQASVVSIKEQMALQFQLEYGLLD